MVVTMTPVVWVALEHLFWLQEVMVTKVVRQSVKVDFVSGLAEVAEF